MTVDKQCSPEVIIRVATDADANRVSAVLEALGYSVVRSLDEGDGPSRLAWAIERLASRHKLTDREREVLAGVLAGQDNQGLARALQITRATVKWHLHNVFAKTATQNREALLRAALQLGEGVTAKPEYHAEPDDITQRIER